MTAGCNMNENLTPEIVMNGDHFAIVDKPAGWLSVPSRQGAEDARPCVGRWLEERCGCQIFPVHRLDECVTGLLLFAKSAKAHAAGNRWFEHGIVQKEYEALTRLGDNPPPWGTPQEWVSWLAKGKKRAYVSEQIGKKSITFAECAGVWREWLFWSLRPRTGRSHQLRFELAQRGFPIAGDALYGSSQKWPGTGIALRMCLLDFRNCVEAEHLGLPKTWRTPCGIREKFTEFLNPSCCELQNTSPK